jgi:hypothetical protein
MPFDAHKNLAIGTIAIAPTPATSGTLLAVGPSEFLRFPAAPFNVTIWPANQIPTPINAEIARVTEVSGDFFTIVRAQEGSTARAIVVGDLILNPPTVKTFTDIESGVNFPRLVTPGGITSGTGAALAGAGQVLVGNGNTPGANYTLLAGFVTHFGTNVPGPENQILFYTPGGLAGYIQTNGTTTAYLSASDARLKQDQGVVGRAVAGAVLRDTVIHDFIWTYDGRPGRGVFAQEAVSVAPGAVAVGSDEVDEAGRLVQPWAVDYTKYVPDLIVGWQAHEGAIAALEARIAALEARVAALAG